MPTAIKSKSQIQEILDEDIDNDWTEDDDSEDEDSDDLLGLSWAGDEGGEAWQGAYGDDDDGGNTDFDRYTYRRGTGGGR
tara:strand:+ start:208 stop:447 length:240 start_codon:yes stop_codon:yes gene_type:complete